MSKALLIVMERKREVYEHIVMPSAVWLPSKQIDHCRCICITSTTRECKEIKETSVYCICGLKASYDWIPRDTLFKYLEIRLKSDELLPGKRQKNLRKCEHPFALPNIRTERFKRFFVDRCLFNYF